MSAIFDNGYKMLVFVLIDNLVFEIRSNAEDLMLRSRTTRTNFAVSRSKRPIRRCTRGKTWSRPSKERC